MAVLQHAGHLCDEPVPAVFGRRPEHRPAGKQNPAYGVGLCAAVVHCPHAAAGAEQFRHRAVRGEPADVGGRAFFRRDCERLAALAESGHHPPAALGIDENRAADDGGVVFAETRNRAGLAALSGRAGAGGRAGLSDSETARFGHSGADYGVRAVCDVFCRAAVASDCGGRGRLFRLAAAVMAIWYARLPAYPCADPARPD